MANRKGTKNMDEKVKFAIIKMAKAKVKQCDVAKEFKLSFG